MTVLQFPLRGASAPLSVADSAPPARIVLGVYLRALRRAHRMSQRRSGRHDHVATSTISRVERAESPLKPERLEALLDVYSVAEKDRRYLLRSLPPAQFTPAPQGWTQRDRWDHWADVAGAEADARYVAVLLSASELIEHATTRIPSDLRPGSHRDAQDSDQSAGPAGHDVGMPSWVRTVERHPEQRRTVLIDEYLLSRPVGGPAAAAEQFHHLVELMKREDESRLRIRVLDSSKLSMLDLIHTSALVTVGSNRMIVGYGLCPYYETRSGAAITSADAFRKAQENAYDRATTIALIERAAEGMAKKVKQVKQ
ncbi:Scr1 family TA system antitoxin-like transcriptional regulator [Streptomyces zhihengii]|uniref:Helix-turn-helix domain-containing protein n=1 Tax=Streptomyces zhihengii TaxID=1818004 RepID=A0ABS2V386_9ACTN|nr:Scr1 family TA system antitoxin-like transcriptional regulator [Streptomyces zhihengii]MBM9624134.1 helix-turn-helix domain-containing protein [Streptomyces zhihengii]